MKVPWSSGNNPRHKCLCGSMPIPVEFVFIFWAAITRLFHAWLDSFTLLKLSVTEICAPGVFLRCYLLIVARVAFVHRFEHFMVRWSRFCLPQLDTCGHYGTQIIVRRALTIWPACSCSSKLFTYYRGIVPICKISKISPDIMVLKCTFIPNDKDFVGWLNDLVIKTATYASECWSMGLWKYQSHCIAYYIGRVRRLL